MEGFVTRTHKPAKDLSDHNALLRDLAVARTANENSSGSSRASRLACGQQIGRNVLKHVAGKIKVATIIFQNDTAAKAWVLRRLLVSSLLVQRLCVYDKGFDSRRCDSSTQTQK